MGLDMYLYGNKHVSTWDDKEQQQIKIDNNINFPVAKIVYEIMYWRKANAIHNWFVTNCQGGTDDCRETYISRTDLENLRDICKLVLQNKDDQETILAYLPPTSGFFFGSTDINEYFFQDVEQTLDMLNNVLDNPKYKSLSFTYASSW